MKRFHSTLLMAMCGSSILPASGQDMNNTPVPELVTPLYRTEVRVPAVPGYLTLKCDFHMHTVFSDGIVLPPSRVQEAWLNGLDVIALTDHVRADPLRQTVPGDNNRSYELARTRARELGLVLIKAGEISRSMPPGHFNALFLQDVEVLNQTNFMAALEGAAKQGAFIQWNHPGWKSQQPEITKWWPEHQQIYEKGWMHGIEVFNSTEWYPVALDWCLSKNLAVMCDTDLHGATSLEYDLHKWPRPMTLVFSTDRGEGAIKKALFDGRTVAWFGSNLAGKTEHLEALFRAAIRILPAHYTDDKGNRSHHLVNTSDLPWKIKEASAAFKGEVWLPRAGSAIIKLAPEVQSLTLVMSNAHTAGQQHLRVQWKL
jgi:3',5'-nucleoside bisphosphate phosphatase